MDRRAAISVIAACLLAPSGTQAQPIAKIPTLGFLGPPPSAGGLVQAFQSAMRDLGYVEGHNIKVEYRYTDAALQGNPERMDQLAVELVRLRPEVLVVSVTEAALAVKRATSTIPIVMVNV